ncbi:aromatic compound degradation protein PaaI [Enemella dayhoffiae]|uniref:Aromatic compound degradation protein PaaI n=1 Tax=Enemella dayhoffiae TaxID=2016507 RepID=A0A255HE95_9ACTN|nr:PaaI family thioesterase [Enemella dayhoffiae]OYO24684.1 aromatic compound degradation protein PaaI [Enemella dayhoffiae]
MTLPDWYHQMRCALDEKLGLEVLEISPERTVGRMPVEGNTQPVGYWHGGATCVLAESLGSLAATAHALPKGRIALGVDINATHHRAARSGWITGVATALALGGRVATYEVVLTDDHDHRIATARISCQLVDHTGVRR